MKPGDGITYFAAGDVEQLELILSGFLGETQAKCAALVDRTGRLLTSVGDTGSMDRIIFASLVAGDFAASDQLASLLGEPEFSSLYHHGEGRSMYLADIAGWAILAALFDGKTTLGMVRLKSKATVPKFASLFADLAARKPPVRTGEFQEEWVSEAESEIDRLFAE
jgi:predicted regulator of Ras-like GTPase activity (Roadblock/LC7/MglB family)